MKKPLPSIARSVFDSVLSKVPWAKTLSTLARPTPRPTWDSPPEPEMALDSRSEKTVRLALKPMVLVEMMHIVCMIMEDWIMTGLQEPQHLMVQEY